MNQEWQEWKQTIMQACQLGRNGQLAIPLGKWSEKYAHQDGFFLDLTADDLYE